MKFKDLKIGDKFTATFTGVKVDHGYAGVTTPTNGTNAFYVSPDQEISKSYKDLEANRVIVSRSSNSMGLYLGSNTVIWEGASLTTNLSKPATEEFYAYVRNR